MVPEIGKIYRTKTAIGTNVGECIYKAGYPANAWTFAVPLNNDEDDRSGVTWIAREDEVIEEAD
jgi:hypothetical protein